MRKCPFCAEEIQEEAIKCRHCGEFLSVSSPRPSQALAHEPESDRRPLRCDVFTALRSAQAIFGQNAGTLIISWLVLISAVLLAVVGAVSAFGGIVSLANVVLNPDEMADLLNTNRAGLWLVAARALLLDLGVGVAILLLGSAVMAGSVRMFLTLVDGGHSTVRDLFSSWRLAPSFLAANLLLWLVLATGFILLILPGAYASLRFSLCPYLVVDARARPLEALRLSYRLTRGHVLELFIAGFALGVVAAVGILLLLVGTLVTGPITALAMAVIYRQLHPLARPQVHVPVS